MHDLKVIWAEAAEGGDEVVISRIDSFGEVVRKLVFVEKIISEIARDFGVRPVAQRGGGSEALADKVLMTPFGKATLGVDRAVESVELEFGGVALIVNIASR